MANAAEQGAKAQKTKKPKVSKNRLRFRLMITAIILLVSFSSMVAVTFAWYVYQTGARTSDIRMAVGTGSSLQISNKYDGEYGSSTVVDEFRGLLVPVSTDRILGGFQKATGFAKGMVDKPLLVANLFGGTDSTEYYKTEIFLRVAGDKQNIYLSSIGFEDDDPDNPLSTAIRIGFVVHKAGKDQPVDNEYIFALNLKDNPKAVYNTATGMEGYVLDSTKTDGTTIPMERLFTADNFCNYDSETGIATKKEKSLAMFMLEGDEAGGYGTPVQVDIYVWLEGCDKDCADNLQGRMLKKIALSFAGMDPE